MIDLHSYMTSPKDKVKQRAVDFAETLNRLLKKDLSRIEFADRQKSLVAEYEAVACYDKGEFSGYMIYGIHVEYVNYTLARNFFRVKPETNQ